MLFPKRCVCGKVSMPGPAAVLGISSGHQLSHGLIYDTVQSGQVEESSTTLALLLPFARYAFCLIIS
jgi:hypothetical protein